MIRTITTKAGALLLDARLPAEFWAEAIQTAVYLHARSPSQSNKGKTPFEMIYHEKPELHHLRRFGCLAYKLVPVPQHGEKKFGRHLQECIILGYVHQTTKIWRLWNPSTKKVIQASDVRFDEERLVSLVAGTDVLRTVLQENEAMNTVWFDDDDNDDDDDDRDLDSTMVGDVVEDGSPGIEMLDNGDAGHSSPGTLDSRMVIEREGEVVDQDLVMRPVRNLRDYTPQIFKFWRVLKRFRYHNRRHQYRLNPAQLSILSPLLSSAVPYESTMYRPRLQLW